MERISSTLRPRQDPKMPAPKQPPKHAHECTHNCVHKCNDECKQECTHECGHECAHQCTHKCTCEPVDITITKLYEKIHAGKKELQNENQALRRRVAELEKFKKNASKCGYCAAGWESSNVEGRGKES